METEKPNKKTRRARSREGGYKWMKGNLYARIQYQDDTGKLKEKLRRVPSGKITDVWKAVRQMRDELTQHGEETLNADKMTFLALAEKYKEAKVFPAIIKDGHKVAGLKSHKPVETYVKIASAYFGKKLIRSIKPRDVDKFRTVRLNTPVEIEIKKKVPAINEKAGRKKNEIIKEKRVTERKLSSVNRELATLRRMLNFAVNEGWLIANPFQKTDKVISNALEKARERVLEYEEEKQLLAQCKDEREHIKPILICALDTAMRPEEIYKLIWSDIDFLNGIIIIRAENTKTETERIVGITPRLQNELERLWEQSPKDLTMTVFGVKSIKTTFKTACRKAEIKNFRFRDCRHTATTRMVNSGMPQAEIMKTTGHTQLKTFLRYVNLTAESVSESAKSFGKFLTNKIADARYKHKTTSGKEYFN
ncbi:MAG: integrase [Pyrinomonadaceae bacterium]